MPRRVNVQGIVISETLISKLQDEFRDAVKEVHKGVANIHKAKAEKQMEETESTYSVIVEYERACAFMYGYRKAVIQLGLIDELQPAKCGMDNWGDITV